MSDVLVISPRQGLIEAVAERIAGRGKDFSTSLVLFPGRRPVHFLHAALAARVQSAFVPPRALSIDDLVEHLLGELGLDRPRIEPIDAAAILFDVHARARGRLGGESYATLDTFFPLGMKLLGELEEVALAELLPWKIRDALQSVRFPKFHSLWYYYENFYAEVERRGLATRAVQYRLLAGALDRVAWDTYERIIAAGFYAFTSVERRIMKHLLTLDQTSFIFQEGTGLQRQLRQLGLEEKDVRRPESPPGGEPSIHFYQAPDTHGQIFAMAARLQKQESFDETTVIVLPSPESLFPVLHGALPVVPGENYNISLGYPLKRTPVYGFFHAIMELVAGSFRGEFSPAAYVEFMLHPYVKNIRFGTSSEATRIMVHSIEDHLEKAGHRIFFSLETVESDTPLAERMRGLLRAAGMDVQAVDIQRHVKTIHDNTIRKFMHFGSVRDCSDKAIEVLTYIFQHSTAKLHQYFHPYCESCVEVLERVGSSLLADKSFADLPGYFAFLRQALEDVTVPFPGTPVRGVQVLGLLETRGIRFEKVYYLDATDDIIPGRHAPDMLLPQSIRALLGMETYRERDQLKEYYFNLVVEGAKEVHLFYTETQEGQKEKSRFVEKLLWKLEKARRIHAPDAFVSDVRYRLNLANPGPSPIKKTPEMVEFLRKDNRFSASQLDTYLRCPLRFYYQTVLGLRERDEVSQDVDVMKIGSLVHTILSELFTPAVGETLTEEHLAEGRLREAVDRCFEREYGKELVGPVYFIRQQVMLQLGKYLNDYEKPRLGKGPAVIEGVEWKRELKKGEYTFVGKIDRVEKRDGATVIVDYKTGSDEKYVKIRPELLDPEDRTTWGGAIGSFQLPMYMMLYAELTGTPIENIAPLYLFLGRTRVDQSIESSFDPSPDVYRSIEQVMFKLVDEIADASVEFVPTADFDRHCPDCPYNVMCGTQWVKAGRD